MVTRYRLARAAGYSFLSSLAFALFNRKPRDVQQLLDESRERLAEFQKKVDEQRSTSD